MIREALAEACKERGGNSALAKALEVHASTVTRWANGGDIPPPLLKLLAWYFFGVAPPHLAEMITNVQGVLEFTDEEWRMINIMANRVGLTPEKWIASGIREVIALRSSQATAGNIQVLDRVAEDGPAYKAKKKFPKI